MLGITQFLILAALRKIRLDSRAGTARNIRDLLLEQHGFDLSARQINVTLKRSMERGLIDKTHMGYDLEDPGYEAIAGFINAVAIGKKLLR